MMRISRTRLCIFLLVLGWSMAAVAEQSRTLHVYHIGNSLTRSITMDRLHSLFAEQGIDYQSGCENMDPIFFGICDQGR